MSKKATIEDLCQSILSSVKRIQDGLNAVGEHKSTLPDVIGELRRIDTDLDETASHLIDPD